MSVFDPACSHAGGFCTFPWSRIGSFKDIPRDLPREIVMERMGIDMNFENYGENWNSCCTDSGTMFAS